jgi:hypothetical protein
MLVIYAFAAQKNLGETVTVLEKRFGQLVYDTSTELAGQAGVPIQRLKYDLTLLPLEIKADHVTYITRNLAELKKAEDVIDIFMLLNTYWDHFNYMLLKVLVDLHGSEDLKQKMTSYVSDLQYFWRQTKVIDFVNFCRVNNYKIKPWPATQAPLNFSQLKCTIKKSVSECTLYDLESIRCQFSEGLHLHDFALVLFEIGESSVVITWLLDAALERQCRKVLALDERNFLKRLSVKKITIDKEEVYEVSKNVL